MNERIVHRVWLGGGCPPVSPLLEDGTRPWREILWTESNIHELGLQPSDYEHSTFAGSSNVIRLHALRKHGGIYLDTDVEILKPFDRLLMFDAFVARQADGPLCNAVFGATPAHPWIEHMIENYGDQRLTDAAFGCHIMAGAEMFGVTILPTETFYPWSWNEPPDRARIMPDTLAVHHWSGSWIAKEA